MLKLNFLYDCIKLLINKNQNTEQTKIEQPKEETEINNEQANDSQQMSGQILIEYDKDNNFYIKSNIMDMTDSGMESLALLLYYINSKELESYIYESLKDWSNYSEERKQFIVRLSQYLMKLNDIILKKQPKENKVAIKASQVFNFREGFSNN